MPMMLYYSTSEMTGILQQSSSNADTDMRKALMVMYEDRRVFRMKNIGSKPQSHS